MLGGRGGELSSEGESDSRKQAGGTSATIRLEKVSEHSENTEDEVCDSMENDNSTEVKAKTVVAASKSSPQDRKQKESTGTTISLKYSLCNILKAIYLKIRF